MSNTAIKKMVNNYISDVIEGYSEYVSKKHNEDDVEIIIKALKKLDKKLSQKVNQDELMRQISALTKTKSNKKNTKSTKSTKSTRSTKKCKDDEILNPASNRCVKRNGPTGKKLLSK
jgi:hypothetical protein